MSITQAFENFLEDTKCLEDSIHSSTKCRLSNDGSYVVELFPDGTYRPVWSERIGNRYDPPGILLSIPSLSEDDMDEDPDACFYDNAIETLKLYFAQAMEDWC